MSVNHLGLLQLMQLSDSAVPIGAAAHSFGLEGLAESGGVTAATLADFIETFLDEQGVLEACFCRAGYQRGLQQKSARELSFRMSALKPARETREASVVLGKRLLGLVAGVASPEHASVLQHAFVAGEQHHAVVFGYVGAVLAIDEEMVLMAFLHQAATTVVSSAQRLAPVGQRQAASVLWNAKAAMINCAERSRGADLETVGSFLPELEIASMRHPNLETRLFLS